MSDTAIRYITMLCMVPREPRSITTSELSNRLEGEGFNVGVRSIQRDLEKLSGAFPLQSDESVRPYRWFFGRDAMVNIIPAMDLSAALTFELAKAYLGPVLPQRALAHLQPHFDEAHRALQRESPLSKWPGRVRVINRGLSGQRPEIDPDVLETVTEALLMDRQCELRYQARQWNQAKIIRVHPFGLVFRDPNVYLIGKIEGREGVRQLVLHRATDSELINEPVVRPDDFNLDHYIESGNMGVLFSKEPINLRLRCDKPMLSHLLEAPLGDNQLTTEQSDSAFEIAVSVSDTQDLRWWLTAQAPYLDILEPQWLREEITGELTKALKRSKSSP